MLLGDFFTYELVDKKEGEISAAVKFNKGHDIFKGHFPDVPVVPGVCQVQLIKEILSVELESKLQISNAREIKFITLINPEITGEVSLSITYEYVDEEILKISAQIFSEETIFLKLRAELIKKKKSNHSRVNHNDICVIIPTYNNGTKIREVIEEVKQHTANVIVVNDGSTDNTAEILESFNGINIVSHNKNKGKGIALKTGFDKAKKDGFSYAITIDSDGQHSAKDIPLFIDKIQDEPDSIIIGSRYLNQENMPGKSSFANKFSNFWYNFQTGLNLQDTQSGYRLYPLNIFDNFKFFSSKYEFELEVIVRAAWKGIPISTVPIDVYYPPKKERITHFRPIRDFLRISILNTVFTFLAIVYFKPRDLIRAVKEKKLRDIVKQDIISANTPIHIIATSIGFGVFMGIIPIWGYQLAAALLLAHLFKLKKTIVFLASNISIPPMLPFILYLSYVTGSYVLGKGSWIVDIEMSFSGLKENVLQYFIGSVVFAVTAGITTGFLSFLLLFIIKKIRKVYA